MAEKRVYDSSEFHNWLKQWKAVFITRRALLPSVTLEAKHLHKYFLQKASNEQTCSSDHSPISYRLPIPCRYHEKLRYEINAIHKRKKPSWRNASTDTWRDSPFAVAKLFMQPAGYDDKSSFDEIDFNGLAAFIYNCGRFTIMVRTLSDEARKYVNKIRHMPDICSSALTDQATVGCIDSMVAVLNDPSFDGDPEVLEARKQLEELKTEIADPNADLLKFIIEDIAIRGVQEITELASAKEDEWSQKASEIKGAIEKLGGILMSSLGEQGGSAICDIKTTFENALAQLDSSIDNAKKIIIETTEEGILKLTAIGQSERLELEEATLRGYRELEETTLEGRQEVDRTTDRGKQTLEDSVTEGRDELLEMTMVGKCELMKTSENITRHLEDTTADGRNEILETAIVGIGELKDTVESGKHELMNMIGNTKQDRMNEREAERESKLTKAKSDLQKQLINHYKENSIRMKVRVDIDAAVEDIYETPKLILKNRNTKGGTIKDTIISEINKIFLSDDGTMAKTVFVEGESGSGKSSLCKKIVDDWCKLKQDEYDATKKDNRLSQFEFLFYIRLREVEDQCKIKDMILQCLIERINSDDKESKELLADILKSECCLLLLDGLDEWKHCSKCKRDERIPHVETGWMNCTTLITTRPYKLAEMKVSRSKISNHVQLEGVHSPEELIRRILVELEKDQVETRAHTCVEYLKMKGLWHFSEVPIVLVHITWLWYRYQLKAYMSVADVYEKIIGERWCEMNDKKNILDNKLPKEILESLSKLAFNQLFSENENESIVFGITEGQLENDYKQQSLDSGILSCSREIGERSVSYHFLHKTLQEYLSALYLAKSGSDLPKLCQHIQTVYALNRKEDVLSLSQIFLFLCGLNITAAEVFSKTLNELFTAQCEGGGYSNEKAVIFQDMILRGYEEAERAENTVAEFCLQHVVLDQRTHISDSFCISLTAKRKKSKLKMCLETGGRKSNIVSLFIRGERDHFSVFQSKKDPTLLDLETCKNLKFVVLETIPHEDINQLNCNGLLDCTISFSKYTPANKLIYSLLSSDLTRLKKFSLCNFGWECNADDIFSKLNNVEKLALIWSRYPTNDTQFSLEHLRHLKYLNQLSLNGLSSSDVVNLHLHNLQKLKVRFRTEKRAPQLMTALLEQSNDYLNSNLNGPLSTLTDVELDNMIMSAEVFGRLVSMMIRMGHSVNCKLDRCSIEPEEDARQEEVDMENQPVFQMMTQSASPEYTTDVTLRNVTMSAGVFRRVVNMVIQSGHPVNWELWFCSIEHKEDARHMTMKNQPTLQMVAPDLASLDYSTHITLRSMTMSAGVFRRLVSMVVRSGHSVNCELWFCTIEPEEDERQLQVDMENQHALQMGALQPASPGFTTHISLSWMTISTGVFRRLISMLVQSRHSINCTFRVCKITTEEDVRQLEGEMKNKSALQVVVPQSALPEYTTSIKTDGVTMSAETFRCLLSIVIHSGHSVDCQLQNCKIEPEADVKQLLEEMENQPALKVTELIDDKVSDFKKWHIEFKINE